MPQWKEHRPSILRPKFAKNLELGFLFCLVLFCLNQTNCNPPGSSVQGIFQARILEYYYFLLQGIFLTQRLNPCLLHWLVDSSPLVPPRKPRGCLRLHQTGPGGCGLGRRETRQTWNAATWQWRTWRDGLTPSGPPGSWGDPMSSVKVNFIVFSAT